MSLSSKITYYKRRITDLLENQGYWVVSVNGDLIDLIAFGKTHTRIIIIREFSNQYMERILLNKLKELKVPEWTIKEVWSKKGRTKDLYNVEIL